MIRGADAPPSQEGCDDDTRAVDAADGAGGSGAGLRRPARAGATNRPDAQPLLLLPLLLLPAQLLAQPGPAVAGAAGRAVHAAARLHGLPAVQRAALALRILHAAEILPRLPLLARPVLSAE